MNRGLITVFISIIIVFSWTQLNASAKYNKPRKSGDDLQRIIQMIDYRETTRGNIDMYFSNIGKTAQRDSSGTSMPGCFWPRGSQNSYIFGQGICFAAKKVYNGDTSKLFHLAYNPNTSKCWTIAGRIEDGANMLFTKREKYQVYFSDDFDKVTGEPLDPNSTISWPLWKKDNSASGYFGVFVFDENTRDNTNYPLGPDIISSQDIHCVFKDTDLSYYEHSQDSLTKAGYPLNIQYEMTAYFFDDDAYKDMAILRYKIINMSQDTLHDSWFGMVSDNDVKVAGADSTGQTNDVAMRYINDPSLNLSVTYTYTDKGEEGKGFGYFGLSMLETPAVDNNGYLRKDKPSFTPGEQLNMKTFLLFPIGRDTSILNNLYDNISSEKLDINLDEGDLRLLLGTGPFNMLPSDTTVVAFMLNFASPANGGEADGSVADMKNLIDKVRAGRDFYYNQHLINNVNETVNGNFSFIKIYPNPSSDFANVSFNIPSEGHVSFQLLNTIGQTVESLEKVCNPGVNNFYLNLADLTPGVYILKLGYMGLNKTQIFTVLK